MARARALLPALVLLALATAVPRPAAAVRFRMPVVDPSKIWADFLIHVDHDPVERGDGNIHCLIYDGREDFPYCYDQHEGTDFILDGGFPAMDAGSLQIVAAADGLVTYTRDGNYDRCHADLGSQAVSCDGNPMQANYVQITHDDGTVTLYYHMKKGSVAVTVGQRVSCGDVLGLVGSSGNSSMPHVHFQVEDGAGGIIDPYAGINSQPESWWVVEDAGNGLPGPWCEGQAIPAEPVPETLPEAAPEVAPEPVPEAVTEPAPEPVPEALPEAPPDTAGDPGQPPADLPLTDLAQPDPGGTSDLALPDRGADEGGDPGASATDVAPDAPAAADGGPILPASPGGLCSAGTTGGPAPALALVLIVLALLRVAPRRERE